MPADGGAAPATAPHPGRTTQLMYACSQGDLHQVKRILHEQPETLTHLDRTYRSALHYCAGGSTLPVFPSSSSTKPTPRLSHCADILLMAAPDLVHARDQDGFTPLHLAVIAGNVQLVHFLLANGADVNALDQEMHSVVHWATVCGKTAALGAVLAAGAEVSTPDVHGGYPLHYAAQMCGSEKPELGLQVLHILLNHAGISVSVTDNDGRQPLLWAASAGSARAVLALVRAGAAAEAADKDGLTALHCAASRGHTDTLDTLLTLCGAQTDVIDSNGCTALHYSVTLGHADATALLLSHSADPNLQDRKGRSPAHCGCAKGQLETVRQLHTSGANLWLRTARGDLPLHEAAASGRRQLVRWLLDQRPSQVNARNNDGRGLLHLAALNDNADMCKILLDSGATVNPLLRTSKNVFMTPLDCALQRGFRSTAKFLQLHGGVPANRLNTLRLTTELTSNLTTASHLHIREDITIVGSSSSETEAEETHKSKDHQARRKTVRKKLSHRYDRRRRSYSGSEQELKTRTKSSSRSAHEKASKKRESERRAKSRDSAVRKEIEVKSDGKQFRKKKQEETEESISETEVSDENARQKTAIRIKTSDLEKRKRILDIDLQKQNQKQKNGYISNLDTFKKTPSHTDRKKLKKSQQDEFTRDLSDLEKSRKITSDRERRKGKNYPKGEENNEEVRMKKQKSLTSNGENSDSERKEHLETEKNKNISDIETKSKRKCKKSDVSDSDQKSKISESERKKRKSADKSLKDKSIEEISEEKEDQKVENEQSTTKVTESLKSVSQEEHELQSKEETELTLITAKLEEEKLQTHEEKTVEENKDEQEAQKLEEENQESIEANTDITATEQEESPKVIDEDTEQPSESFQADQVSLQSKLSEESPSKTIVVEAAVHHPPKGMDSEEVTEELQTVIEESKESIEETKEVLEETSQIIEDTKETLEENKIVNESKKVAVESQEDIDESKEVVDESNEVIEDAKETVEELREIATEASEIAKDTEEVAEEVTEQMLTEEKLASQDVDVGKEQQIVEGDTVDDKQKSKTEKDKLNNEEEELLEVEDKEPKLNEDIDSVELSKKESVEDVLENSVSKDEENIAETENVIEESQNVVNEMKEDENVKPKNETDTMKEESPEVEATTEQTSIVESKEEEKSEQQANEVEDQKQDEVKVKNELNIDLSLKKFEESAELQNEDTDVDETENMLDETISGKQNGTVDEPKQKIFRKKVKLLRSQENVKSKFTKTKDSSSTEVKQQEIKAESSSTSFETSSSDSESEKSTKKSKIVDGEHKSFKVLRDDVAFEVLNDPTVKETRRIRKHSKRRQKEVEKLNESATSSPEMLESVRIRSKSVPRQKSINQTLTLPSLTEGKRPDSNLSAPNLSSVYSDNDQKSGSNSEADDLISSASRKKRIKKRSKLRAGSKSAGSDYESSNLIDSGFEPSPRSSRIPKRKVMSERGVNMTSVTQQIQSNIRRYHMERKIFQHLLDLKRLQIRSGQANEAMLVKRAIDAYHNSVAASVGAGRYLKKDFTYKSFEQFLYHSLRMLQKTPTDHLKGLPEAPDNPLLCTQSTHRCLHATHAYTGIPCAAYLPKMNHHTMPKIGFNPRSSSSFLPQINSKGKSVTLELCHGNDKQVISLPADRLDHNKRYYVTFTVKGQDGQSPTHQETTSHRHAKSV